MDDYRLLKGDYMRIFLTALMVLFCGAASAEVYVYSYKDSKEVVFITEEDNVIYDETMDKTVLPNSIDFYNLTESYSNYKLSGKKLVLNTAKISEQEKVLEDAKKDGDKKQSDFESAKKKLMDLGLTSDEVQSLK